MSHDIDQTTGKPAIAYVGQRPWHGLGEQLLEHQPIETWLTAAKLDWELQRLPVQYLVDGTLRTMDDRFVLARSDTSEALSIVSDDYHIVQPREVLEFYRDLMKDYGYTLETAGALDHGRKVWALARTGVIGTAGSRCDADRIAAYVLLATSCDKSLATTAAFTSIRVVCQNTLFFAADDVKQNSRPHVKVNHNHRFDADQVKDKLGLLDPAWQSFITKVREMTKYKMNDDDARSFFRSLWPPLDKPLTRAASGEFQTISAFHHSAPGQNLSTAKGTLWGAVNAVTYYVDYVRRGNGERLDGAWFGTGNFLKERAWNAASDLLAQAGR